jgi:hypothetical protein
MATDSPKQPQPSPQDAPKQTHDVDPGDEKAAKALEEIAKLQRKLEPNG